MKQHIYPILASQRRRLGLSQQQVAALAGLRREKVSRVESKSEDISLDELSRLLDVVGLELAVREKESRSPSFSAMPVSHSARHLPPQDFRKASFIDGSKAKIVSWGKVLK
jgi:transcriptional regulator with XRE-family HTH domain